MAPARAPSYGHWRDSNALSTRIRFGLDRSAPVTLKLFGVDGRLVRTLLRGEEQGRGYHEVPWDGRDEHGRQVGSGVFTYQLVTPHAVLHRKLVVLR